MRSDLHIQTTARFESANPSARAGIDHGVYLDAPSSISGRDHDVTADNQAIEKTI
jgi:hypothetical protein